MILNLGVSLPDLPQVQGIERMGEISRVALQRLRTAGVLNGIANPLLKASWTPLLTASDSTKVVCTPLILEPVITAGAVVTQVGQEGVALNMGREATTFTGNFTDQPQTTAITPLKVCQYESMGVYIVDQFGIIWCKVDNVSAPTKYLPIPIQSFFVGDLTGGVLNTSNKNAISWNFAPNWSDNLVGIKPTDFDAKMDLFKPSEA